MKILITGSNGFVGSNLADYLLEQGYSVVCLVRKSSDCKWLAGKKLECRYGDLNQPETLINSLDGIDALIHAGGVVRALKKETYYEVNQVGTRNLVNAILSPTNKTCKKIIYISSQAAMGPSTNDNFKEISEQENPVSDYGKSKLAGEKELVALNNKIPYTILRPASVYGPRDKDLFIFFNLVNKGIKPFTLTKKNIQLTFVQDICKVSEICLLSDKTNYKTFCLAEPIKYTWEQTAKTIAKAINKKTIPLPLPSVIFWIAAAFSELISLFTKKPAVLNFQKIIEMQQKNWLFNTNYTEEELSFTFTKLEIGAKITNHWYKNNKWL